jgi:hypothetical protein
MNIICTHCFALHFEDEHLAKSGRRNPKFGTCCNQGKVKVVLLQQPPEALQLLLTGTDPTAKAFRRDIRKYNAALAMCSLGVKQDRSVIENGGGPYVFKIQGGLYHLTGGLAPDLGGEAVYAQLWIYDGDAALDQRMRRNQTLDRGTMQTLQDMLAEHHIYTHLFKQAWQVMQQLPPGNDTVLRLLFNADTDDRRTHNLPIETGVAALLPGTEDQVTTNRDILLHKQGGGLQRIHEGHPAYHPTAYPLLFPYGQAGWHWGIPLNTPAAQCVADDDENEEPVGGRGARKTVTQLDFYRFRLHPRQGEPDYVFCSEKLLQQFIVDCWAATDQERLRYLQTHQKELRAELYKGLHDAVAGGENNLAQLGKRLILPSSFIGGSRHMRKLYQNSMAIVRQMGHPDVFITMTADPMSPEIKEAIGNAHPSMRPDIVARVFRLKVKELERILYTTGYMGRVVGHVHTIEFQKRGLPYIHLIIFFASEHKLRTPEAVDSLIRAYIPDPELEPEMHAWVMKYMIHTPCGHHNPNAPCMVDGKCSKNFPKAFQEETVMDRNRYPSYRRPNNGKVYKLSNGVEVDNRWVVPYSPALLSRLPCHMNVECVYSIKSIKYMHKYIYKGHDRTTMAFGQDINEIEQYLTARYVSSHESIWRLFSFPLHKEYPTVYILHVHLPDEHTVTYRDEQNAQHVIDMALRKDSILMAFFKAAQNIPSASNLLYQEMPDSHVWNEKKHTWGVRQRGDPAIGRMVFVHPNAGERYFLRLLLTTVRGKLLIVVFPISALTIICRPKVF